MERYIYLNSKDNILGNDNPTDVVLNLPYDIENFCTVELMHFSTIYTWYNIPVDETFTYDGINVDLEAGLYDFESLKKTVKAEVLGTYPNFDMDVSSSNRILVIEDKTAPGAGVVLDFTGAPNAAKVMGFDAGVAAAAVSGIHEGIYIPQLLEKEIFCRIDEFMGMNNVVSSNSKFPHVTWIIPQDTSARQMLTYNQNDSFTQATKCRKDQVQQLHINWFDQDGEALVDMDDWHMVLKVSN